MKLVISLLDSPDSSAFLIWAEPQEPIVELQMDKTDATGRNPTDRFDTGRFDTVAKSIVATMLLYSVALIIYAIYQKESLGEWIWDRHQNQFSWYSRPLFLVPACYYAYRRKIGLVVGFMTLLGCSLFWFAAPATVPKHVSGYLEWEKQLFFSNESSLPLLLLIAATTVFLFSLFFAFWQRNPWWGLLLINIGTALKIVVSVVLGKEAGLAAIVPSLSSLVVINTIAFAGWKLLQRRKRFDLD